MNLPGGAVGLEALGPVDAMACDMGWSVNVQFDGGEILDRLPALKGIRARWILDHHGKFFAGATPGDARIAAVKRLIDRGNCWFKMAGGYESSRSGAPGGVPDIKGPQRPPLPQGGPRVPRALAALPRSCKTRAKTNTDIPCTEMVN